MKFSSFIFAILFACTLGKSRDPRDLDRYVPFSHPRLRHSRHLEGYTPIQSTPRQTRRNKLPTLRRFNVTQVARTGLLNITEFVTGPNGKLTVQDNHKPVFKECFNYKPVVKEESPIGTYVFTIEATDKDPLHMGGTVTYKFVTTPGEKERFIVEPHTGRVYTADVFDHDEPSREKEVYITVRVTDNGQPSLDDACTIKITIEDINDNPPVFDKVSYSESVPQDLQLNREVMRISATDIDDGNNSVVHYSLDPNSPDASYFYIDPANGVIFLNKTIDKTPGYKFKLSAIVKDMGDPPMQSSITLDVQVVESNKKSPSFIEVPEDVIRLKENYNDFRNPIATVRATSNIPDEEKVQFELVQGQTEQTNKHHTFVLEPDGDVAYVKIANHLDYEQTTEYTLTIRIQNNYRLAAETIINIEVEDVNDNIPIFSEIRSGTVLENEPKGTQVMQVRAIDHDGTSANNQVTYELGDPSDPFYIDPVTGNITTLKMFDREEKSFYNIKITATDNSESALIAGTHNVGQQTFIIEIADKNDNPPHFTQDTYIAESVAENANINELVTQVTAEDVDTASIVTYSIVSGNTYDSFTIRNFTGEIRVNKELDYENLTTFKLDVRAFDGVFEDFAKVVIRIENLNDNPPVFLSNYTKIIEEEKLYDGCIVRVEAYDPDIPDRAAPQNIVYSLVKDEQKAFLQIDNDGCLRLTKPLDRDQPTGFTRWQVLIMAADHGGRLGSDSLRSTTEVILELTDINDNAPFLTNTQPVVWYENEHNGQVLVLTAKDYDSPENGPPFTFALNDTTSFDIKSKFQIQGNVLYAITSFDREEQKEYFVPILITDSGTPRMTGLSILHVIIGDKNDNAMSAGFSSVFVYNYKPVMFYRDAKFRNSYYSGESPDTEVGRVYVQDPDDWDVNDKRFIWLPSFELRSPFFDVHSQTGMITMKQGTPNGTYVLKFNVTEENEPVVHFHWVEAIVNVTVKEIPEEAVDKSGSVRFVNITAEEFIVPETDGFSKKEKFHWRLSRLFNESMENVDVFTVSNKQTVKDEFLDVRFSAHGSPYFTPEKMNTMLTGIQEKLEEELSLRIYMINIDECLIEKEQCEDSCRNVLMKNNVPLAVYTNTTSFIGVSAMVEPECTCEAENQLICLNGGTPFADKCECPEGYLGPRCEQTAIGFHGDGWAMYPPPPACHESHMTLTVTSHTSNCLIFYMGPLKQNPLLNVEDFMSLELVEGFPVLMVNYGSGTTRINNSVVHVSDGKPHLIEIILMKSSIEMFVDRCKMTTCMSLAAPTGNKEILNINGPLQLGGASVDLKQLAMDFSWRHTPSDQPLVGCISNFTFNDYMYNLGEPSYHKNADPSCQKSMFTAVTFGIDTNFLVAILVCTAILIVLLLAVVVHRRRQDTWAEKELDDIRENIIAYEDEGGGEGDAGYDLHVLRQMYEGPPPDGENWRPSGKGGEPSFDRRCHGLRPQTVPARSEPRRIPNVYDLPLRESTLPPKSPRLIPPFHLVDEMITRFWWYMKYKWSQRNGQRPSAQVGEGIELDEIRIHDPDLDEYGTPITRRTRRGIMSNPSSTSASRLACIAGPNATGHGSVSSLAEHVPILTLPKPELQDDIARYGTSIPRTTRCGRLPSIRFVVPGSPGSCTAGASLPLTGPSSPVAGPGFYIPEPRIITRLSRKDLREGVITRFELVGAAPDISGFLDDKKEVMDRDPDALNPFDDVRYYAYEGDGNTSGSLSSLASCTDDGDLKFNYLSTFGPRFRKLADMYGDSEEEGRHDRREDRHDRRDLSPQEESWC